MPPGTGAGSRAPPHGRRMGVEALESRAESRVRRMLRHTWLVAIGGLLAVLGLAAAAFYFASQPTILKVAVGPPNSEDVRVIQTIAQHFARERAAIRLRPIIKDSPAQSAEALDSREADLAVVRRDV